MFSFVKNFNYINLNKLTKKLSSTSCEVYLSGGKKNDRAKLHFFLIRYTFIFFMKTAENNGV